MKVLVQSQYLTSILPTLVLVLQRYATSLNVTFWHIALYLC